MGFLHAHDIAGLARKHDLDYFVETGTHEGDGLLHALRAMPWVWAYSVEANRLKAWRAQKRANARRPAQATVLPGDTRLALPLILPQLNGPTLWWLDAHLPELYEGEDVERLPLIEELVAIATHPRDYSRDVFIIDDWRLYEPVNTYDSGPLPADVEPARPLETGIIFRALAHHDVRVDTRHEGYLIATPKLSGTRGATPRLHTDTPSES